MDITREPPAIADLLDAVRRPTLPGRWRFWADYMPPAGQWGGQPLGPITPTGFSCSWTLNGFGGGEMTLPVENNSVSRYDFLRLWSWRVWAIYDGTPAWCGVPTGIADDGSGTVSLTLTELTGYLQRRQWRRFRRYTQTEQTQIAADIAGPVVDAGVTLDVDAGPGFLRDRSYEPFEGENRAELLTNLTDVLSGPEFRSEYWWVPYAWMSGPDRPGCRLKIGYPRVGRAGSGLGVAIPGSGAEFSLQWDSDMLRTHTHAIGDTEEDAEEGTPRPVESVDLPQPGIPELEAVDDWPSVILAETLQERATSYATLYAQPTLAVSVTVSQSSPPLGTYGVGDDVTVSVTDPLMPDGFDATGRLVEINANAADGTVTWTVVTALPPPKPRPSLTQRLANLDRKTANMFRRNVSEGPEE